jgi:hypothetical protein
MADRTPPPFPHRRKQDGSDDSLCLACFKTISPVDAEADLFPEEDDHLCAFSFPGRRAKTAVLENGNGRRRSDLEWQRLISRDLAQAAE